MMMLKTKIPWLKEYLQNQYFRCDSLLLKKELMKQAVLYVMLPCAILFWFFYSSPHPLVLSPPTSSAVSFPPPPSSPPPTTRISQDYAIAPSTSCDYTNGKWIPTNTAPLYNGTTCGQTIRNRQNCMYHGRPDLNYLHWQWKPTTCNLPSFDPSAFLDSFKHKHIAFIGDSIARNQVESLICLLSSSNHPQLIYSIPDTNAKFRRWRFSSHNFTVSVYWSPFLVNGVERSSSLYYNIMFLNSVDETWANDLPGMDAIVVSIGHWFHYQGVYYENGSVLGSHGCNTLNHTEIGFYEVFRKAYRTAFNTIIDRRRHIHKGVVDVLVTTFTPQHFDSDDWGKLDACSRTTPYKAGEVNVEGIPAEMRRITLEEVEQARKKTILERGGGVRVNALDITLLSLLRPDGHPGPYMNPNPFANGVKERVQNDCLHFCLPGPIDTWNQIMYEFILKQ